MKKCEHTNIEVITEENINTMSDNKKYVVCENCGKRLNINRITSRVIYVD